MDTTETMRSHDVSRQCEHRLVDSARCSKCGWTPPPPDLLGQMYSLWLRLTFEEQLTFLKHVR